jgi:cytochrome c oxidase subunit 3
MKVIEKSEKQLAMHPQKFALWLFIITVVMLFAALTSAYIVRQGEGNWLVYDLPVELWYSTGILILSSVTMHWAYINAKHDNLEKLKAGLLLTTALGVIFLLSQYYVWGILVDHEVYFVGNPSGSFLYVFMGIHGLHLIGGIVFLLIVLRLAYNYDVHSKNLSRLEMCITYWHFLGGLWVYLFLFLLLNHN